jgi:hypothetical protein
MSVPLLGTASAANAIDRVKYSHDAMIDLMIAQPFVTQGELAKHFGYTQAWVSRIINSDAFQARLALRKEDLIDPTIVASIDEKMRAVASKSLDVVLEKLSTVQSFDQGLKAFETVSKALGYGARQAPQVQNNFVVALPQKAASAEEWMQQQRERVVN